MAKKEATTRLPKVTTLIPRGAQFAEINGVDFVRIREAAKLAGLPPLVLQMGQRLLDCANLEKGVKFDLDTPDLKARGADLQKFFKTGLTRVVKALKPNVAYHVKAHRDGAKIVFWLAS